MAKKSSVDKNRFCDYLESSENTYFQPWISSQNKSTGHASTICNFHRISYELLYGY